MRLARSRALAVTHERWESMAIQLTDSAANRVSNYLRARGEGIGLRLGVTKTGCNGYSYVINYADAIGESDVVFEDKGITVVVDKEALPLIDGTEVDFVKANRTR